MDMVGTWGALLGVNYGSGRRDGVICGNEGRYGGRGRCRGWGVEERGGKVKQDKIITRMGKHIN